MLDAVTIPLDGRVSFITPILTEFRILMSLSEILFPVYISAEIVRAMRLPKQSLNIVIFWTFQSVSCENT